MASVARTEAEAAPEAAQGVRRAMLEHYSECGATAVVADAAAAAAATNSESVALPESKCLRVAVAAAAAGVAIY